MLSERDTAKYREEERKQASLILSHNRGKKNLSWIMARESGNREREREQSDYQVFLSFRGCDTRQGFTDCLYHFLTDAGVRVFRDNEELRPGHKIEEVLTAINRSLVCIPILSKSYANSKWCLLELTKMVELEKDIMPIFYKVEADDVKLKTKLYSDDLSRFGKKYDAEKVEWERALKVVGGIFDQAQLEGTFKEVGRIKAWTIMDYPG